MIRARITLLVSLDDAWDEDSLADLAANDLYRQGELAELIEDARALVIDSIEVL